MSSEVENQVSNCPFKKKPRLIISDQLLSYSQYSPFIMKIKLQFFRKQSEERQQWKLEKDSELRLEVPEGKKSADLMVLCDFDCFNKVYYISMYLSISSDI